MSGRIPPEFIGQSPETLQLWLTQAQQALQDLATGNLIESANYAQGTGNRGVTRTRADVARLQERIRQLTRALGLSGGRRAMGVQF